MSFLFLEARAGGINCGTVARVLIVSTNADPDVAEYPDSGKIGVVGSDAGWRFFRRGDAAEHAGPE
jgi:uncharacterized cupin superfamily protein